MITLRRSSDRGHMDHGWLNSYHSFSFGRYYDPLYSGFSDLRVLNEDKVQAGQGFPAHGHRDMEIVSCVLQGCLVHKDSLGNSTEIHPGEVQRMTAGTGVTHSEYNGSSEPLHFLQIWFFPDKSGYPPGYQQKYFTEDEKHNTVKLLVSPTGADGSVSIHQDACLYTGILDSGVQLPYRFAANRRGYLHVIRGEIEVADKTLTGGDAIFIEHESHIDIRAIGPKEQQAEWLLFDLR